MFLCHRASHACLDRPILSSWPWWRLHVERRQVFINDNLRYSHVFKKKAIFWHYLCFAHLAFPRFPRQQSPDEAITKELEKRFGVPAPVWNLLSESACQYSLLLHGMHKPLCWFSTQNTPRHHPKGLPCVWKTCLSCYAPIPMHVRRQCRCRYERLTKRVNQARPFHEDFTNKQPEPAHTTVKAVHHVYTAASSAGNEVLEPHTLPPGAKPHMDETAMQGFCGAATANVSMSSYVPIYVCVSLTVKFSVERLPPTYACLRVYACQCM
jgi:hypothetical protein